MVEGPDSPALLPALEANLRGFWRDYGQAPGSQIHEGSDLWWFATGIPSPSMNRVLLSHLQPTNAEGTINQILATARRLDCAFSWWVGPTTTPRDMAARLERRGAGEVAYATGMALDLGALSDTFGRNESCDIRRVSGPDMQRLWGEVVGKGYGFRTDVAEAFAQIESGFEPSRFESKPRYLAFLDGEPVGASALVLEDGVAGIYAVATLPAARRRGVGAAVTLAPLRDAREQGYRVAVLQSSTMAHALYRRMGFQGVCRFALHVLSPHHVIVD